MFKLILVIVVRTITDLSFKGAVKDLDFSQFGQALIKMALRPVFWVGILAGILNILLWSHALAEFDLSYAYPFLSISYISIIIFGSFIFKEHIDRQKMIGITFISAGAVLLFLG